MSSRHIIVFCIEILKMFHVICIFSGISSINLPTIYVFMYFFSTKYGLIHNKKMQYRQLYIMRTDVNPRFQCGLGNIRIVHNLDLVQIMQRLIINLLSIIEKIHY